MRSVDGMIHGMTDPASPVLSVAINPVMAMTKGQGCVAVDCVVAE